MPDISNIIFSSSLSGLGNYIVKDASRTVGAITPLAPFSSQDFTLTVPLDREDAIAQIQSRFTDFSSSGDDVWRVMSGKQNIIYVPDFATATQAYLTFYSFSGTTLTITIRVSNPTFFNQNTQSFTFNARIFLFVAPFSG